MPELWLKHKNTSVAPFAVPYADGQDADAIAAAWADSGWKPFKPSDAQATELKQSAAVDTTKE